MPTFPDILSISTGDNRDKVKASEAKNRSDELGQAIQIKRERVSQLRQSAYNQKSKERLQAQRLNRQNRPQSQFKTCLEKESAIKEQLAQIKPRSFRKQEV